MREPVPGSLIRQALARQEKKTDDRSIDDEVVPEDGKQA